MRHLSLPRLPILASPPAAPPAGQALVYPATDGSLRARTQAGEGRFPAAARATLTADHNYTNVGFWEPLPLSLQVEPGLYELSMYVTLDADRSNPTDFRFITPTAAFGSMDLLSIQDGQAYQGHWPIFWGEEIFGDPRFGAATMSVTGPLLVHEPGTIRLDAGQGSHFQRADYDFEWEAWDTSGVDQEPSTDFAHGGDYSGKLTAQDSESRAVLFDWFTTTAGTGWRFGAWLYSPAGHPQAGVSIAWYDADGNQISELVDERPLPAGVWTLYQIEGGAPAGAVQLYAQAGMEVAEGHTTGSVVYIDDVELRTTTGWMNIYAGSYIQVTPK
ncbi:hypothetical protein [Nonomuraea sp. NPDC050202]|uniref:hypothetical protein n=1 Tax=Nonomuraea sp. NPDC050202 TaxID=3155035 RepID=UPI0033C5CE9E